MIHPPPESFVKICDEVCDTFSNTKCEAPNNASLRFLVTLKVFSDTFCIVKCAMFWVWLNVAKCGISLGWTETERVAKFSLWYMSQKCCDDCKVHYKLAMGGAPQGAMRVASHLWQVVFASQTLQVFCLALQEDISGIHFFYFIRHINSSSYSRQVF